MTLRVVFLGSPRFAIPSLEKLAKIYHVAGVITQPDKPSGRGRILTFSPVKQFALDAGLPVFQPIKLNTESTLEQLTEWKPDMIIVAACGQILRSAILNFPRYGCLNVHASLLPRWRGASPIQAAILFGDRVSGVSIMKMDQGLDTGPILSQKSVEILEDDTAESLENRLSLEGAQLLCETIPGYIEGKIIPVPQGNEGVTYAPLLKKEDGFLDLHRSAFELERKVRAFFPWPGTYIEHGEGKIKVIKAHVVPDESEPAGVFGIIDKFPAVKAPDGWLVLDVLQPPGKRMMSGNEYLCGAKNWATAAK